MCLGLHDSPGLTTHFPETARRHPPADTPAPADRCGHCKALKPAWIEAAGELAGKVRLGAVDCTVHQSVCQEYGVQVRGEAGGGVQEWGGQVRVRPGGGRRGAVVGQEWLSRGAGV